MKKKSNIKKIYNSLKEAWKVPSKRALIKLTGYFIFFVVFLSFSAVVSRTSKNTNVDEEQIKTEKYTIKQNKLLTNKYNINYVIKIGEEEYKINGIKEQDNINGYLEDINGIKKITIIDKALYEVKGEEKEIIETNINMNLLDLNYIIDLVKKNSAIINRTDDNAIYEYKINDDILLNIKIYIDIEKIYKIEISYDTNEYILNFDE